MNRCRHDECMIVKLLMQGPYEHASEGTETTTVSSPACKTRWFRWTGSDVLHGGQFLTVCRPRDCVHVWRLTDVFKLLHSYQLCWVYSLTWRPGSRVQFSFVCFTGSDRYRSVSAALHGQCRQQRCEMTSFSRHSLKVLSGVEMCGYIILIIIIIIWRGFSRMI